MRKAALKLKLPGRSRAVNIYTLACKLTDDELNHLGVSLTMPADTLFTVAAQRSIFRRNNSPKSEGNSVSA